MNIKLKYYCIFCKEELEFTLTDGQFKCERCKNNLQISEGNGKKEID